MARNKSGLRMSRKKFNTKYISDAFIQTNRIAFKEWAKAVADGYNRIVSSWEETKVTFTPRVRLDRGIWNATVSISGEGAKRFEAIDFGLKRGKTVHMKGGDDSIPDTPFPKIKLPTPPGIGSNYKSYLKAHDSYTKEVAQIKADYAFLERMVSEARSKQNPPAPMRRHIPKTGAGGWYRGSGSYSDKNIVFARTWKMGNIAARNFTTGLNVLVDKGQDPFGVGNIWPGNMRWSSAIERAYARGVRQANATRNSG